MTRPLMIQLNWMLRKKQKLNFKRSCRGLVSHNLKDLTVRLMSCTIYSAFISQGYSLTTPVCKSALVFVQAFWQDRDIQRCALLDLTNISVLNSKKKVCWNQLSMPTSYLSTEWQQLLCIFNQSYCDPFVFLFLLCAPRSVGPQL